MRKLMLTAVVMLLCLGFMGCKSDTQEAQAEEQPSAQITVQEKADPTAQPAAQPAAQPTVQEAQPAAQPTVQEAQPAAQPTAQEGQAQPLALNMDLLATGTATKLEAERTYVNVTKYTVSGESAESAAQVLRRMAKGITAEKRGVVIEVTDLDKFGASDVWRLEYISLDDAPGWGVRVIYAWPTQGGIRVLEHEYREKK